MKKNVAGVFVFLTFSITHLALVPSALAMPTTVENPEAETLRISKLLKPIPDDQWKEIAGDRTAEKYKIEKGDTLYDVSKRLFGDSKYWPKIWALNNDTILNPHVIRPGKQIAFMPGSGTSLPSVAVEENETATDAQEDESTTIIQSARPSSRSRRPREWQNLPQQEWEQVQQSENLNNDVAVDHNGAIETAHRAPATRELPSLVVSEQQPWLGEVSGAPEMRSFYSAPDLVMVTPYEDLQAGKTFAITRAPIKIHEKIEETETPKKEAYVYPILGTLVLTQPRNGGWLARITTGQLEIKRGDTLIPVQPRFLSPMPAVPAPHPLYGRFYVNKASHSAGVIAQFEFGFIDLGTDDGVQPGMIFQAFQDTDPATDKEFKDKESFHRGLLQVIQVTSNFCQVRAINSLGEIENEKPVRAMTDVSNLNLEHIKPQSEIDTEHPEVIAPPESPEGVPVPPPAEQEAPIPPPNELNPLEGDENLTPEEKRELKQLEEHKEKSLEEGEPTPAPNTPETAPLPPPPGEGDELPPPPPEEGAEPPPPPPGAETESVKPETAKPAPTPTTPATPAATPEPLAPGAPGANEGLPPPPEEPQPPTEVPPPPSEPPPPEAPKTTTKPAEPNPSASLEPLAP